MAVDSVEDSHQLLSAYPLASLNATGHGQSPYSEIGSAVTDAYIHLFSSVAPVEQPVAFRTTAVVRPAAVLRAERVHLPVPDLGAVH